MSECYSSTIKLGIAEELVELLFPGGSTVNSGTPLLFIKDVSGLDIPVFPVVVFLRMVRPFFLVRWKENEPPRR